MDAAVALCHACVGKAGGGGGGDDEEDDDEEEVRRCTQQQPPQRSTERTTTRVVLCAAHCCRCWASHYSYPCCRQQGNSALCNDCQHVQAEILGGAYYDYRCAFVYAWSAADVLIVIINSTINNDNITLPLDVTGQRQVGLGIWRASSCAPFIPIGKGAVERLFKAVPEAVPSAAQDAGLNCCRLHQYLQCTRMALVNASSSATPRVTGPLCIFREGTPAWDLCKESAQYPAVIYTDGIEVALPVTRCVCAWFIYRASAHNHAPMYTLDVPMFAVQAEGCAGKVERR